jgi:hypothetical protein
MNTSERWRSLSFVAVRWRSLPFVALRPPLYNRSGSCMVK